MRSSPRKSLVKGERLVRYEEKPESVRCSSQEQPPLWSCPGHHLHGELHLARGAPKSQAKAIPLPTPTLSQAVCHGFSWALGPAGRCGLPNIQNSQGLPGSLRRPRENIEGRCRARSARVVGRSQEAKASPLYGCRQCKFSLHFFRLYPAAHPALHFSPPQHG